jgi:alkylhydroperoxidase family enzyme
VSARIEPPRRESWLARIAYGFARQATGKVPDPLRIVARRPRLLFATVVYEWAIARTPKLQPRLKVLAGLRASSLAGCPF